MDISKVSVVDPRIVQHKPTYAVEKGALSITNQSFTAIANSASQQTFQVQVPSENVFVDRAVDWVNTANVVVTLSYSATYAPASGTALLTPGVNFSLAPFPIHQSVSTMTATINDQTVTVNTSDVLPQILRLADLAKTRMQRTCPTQLDRYSDVQSSAVAFNSPVSDYGSAYSSSEVGNGAWGNLSFYVPSASLRGSYAADIVIVNGLPESPGGLGAGAGTLTVGVRFTTAEKLVLPPFIFADEDELSTGLFGVQNIQFTANFNQPTRSLRMWGTAAIGTYSATAPSVAWDSSLPSGSPFTSAQLQVQFLTPSLDVPLPAKSIVPYLEFPRYISPVQGPILAAASGFSALTQLQSQTITLPSVPDLLVIYVKPQQYADCTEGDWSLPISNISISFDNFSGLLANHSQYELYKMSVNNGVDMDFNEWCGVGYVNGKRGGSSSLVGGPLVLRPGRDFSLSTGMAPGLVGNFTLQMNLTVQNWTGVTYGGVTTISPPVTGGPAVSIYTITANSGFFETMRGSSRILKGVVTEQDILSAPVAHVEEPLERMVGEGKHHRHVGHGSVSHLKKHGMHKYTR